MACVEMAACKNDKQREAFIMDYRNWELESVDEFHGIRFWKYHDEFANIYVEERYERILEWSEWVPGQKVETAFKWVFIRHYLLIDGEWDTFQSSRITKTELIKWIRERQKL